MNREKALAHIEAAEKELAAAKAEILAVQPDLAPPATTVAPTPPEPPPAPPIAAARGLSLPEAFFGRVRKNLGGLTQAQVDGINAILAACLAAGLPVGHAAYVLATPALETGGSFDVRKVENLNYRVDALISKFGRHRISVADAQRLGRTLTRKADQQAIANTICGGKWGLENLGNTQPGDGWLWRGRSWPQATGRKNYQRIDDALRLGGRLMANPEVIFEPEVSAAALVRGMVEGWYTGKALRHYIRAQGTFDEFVNARHIINPGDRAADVAKFAAGFQDALMAGGYP